MRKLNRWMRTLVALTLVLGLLMAAMPAQAAGFTSKKPRIDKNATYYSNGRVEMKYSKVSGATKYEIYRSATRNGTYKKFATSKTTTLSKKASGHYFYKVRAVKGKNKSKFSDPVQIFGATCNMDYINFNGSWGYAGSYGLVARIQIKNTTNKAMNFLGMNQGSFYLIDKTTNKVVERQYAQLNTNMDPYGIKISAGITIPAKKSGSIWVSSMTYTQWMTYQSDPERYAFIVSMPFHAGKGSDTLNTFSIGAMSSAADSSIACK